jgi:hypothetical protein
MVCSLPLGLYGGEIRPSVPCRYRRVRNTYGFVAIGRVCDVDFFATADLGTIEREIGLRVKRQLIKRFLDIMGALWCSTSSTASSSRWLVDYG